MKESGGKWMNVSTWLQKNKAVQILWFVATLIIDGIILSLQSTRCGIQMGLSH